MSSLISRVCRVYCIVAFCFAMSFASIAIAAPQGGKVVKGQGRIEQSGTHTDIYQNTSFMATRWSSFNIAAHESARAHQPNARSRLLIRVDGAGATNIAGSYTSNGITILENQNGVQFSEGAVVNVGGLLATSARLSGVEGSRWRLDGVGGAVVNHGTITAGAGGVVLAAVQVENTGEITSQGGDVAFGAGKVFTVNFVGSLVGFEVKQSASGVSILNEGKVEARGGIVKMTAQEAQNVRVNVISVGGVVKASRIKRRGGFVYLSGGDRGVASVSGKVKADKKVQATGKYVAVERDAKIKAPKILVGGNYQGKGAVPTAARTFVAKDALLDAGQDGYVVVWSDEITWFYGNINAPGGFAEVSGKKHLAAVNFAGIHVGTLLLDPAVLVIGKFGRNVDGDIERFDDGLADDPTLYREDGRFAIFTRQNPYFYGGGFSYNYKDATFIDVASVNQLPEGTTLNLRAYMAVIVAAPIDHPHLNLTLEAEGIHLHDYVAVGRGDLTLIAHVNGVHVYDRRPVGEKQTASISGRNIHINGYLSDSLSSADNDYTMSIKANGAFTITDRLWGAAGIIDVQGDIRIHRNVANHGRGDGLEFTIVSRQGNVIIGNNVQVGAYTHDSTLIIVADRGNIEIGGKSGVGLYINEDYGTDRYAFLLDDFGAGNNRLILVAPLGTVRADDIIIRVRSDNPGKLEQEEDNTLTIIARQRLYLTAEEVTLISSGPRQVFDDKVVNRIFIEDDLTIAIGDFIAQRISGDIDERLNQEDIFPLSPFSLRRKHDENIAERLCVEGSVSEGCAR